MNKKRLLKLADLLEEDAKNKKGVKFDLGVWAAPAGRNVFDERPEEEGGIEVSCNTTACAMGLAVISGKFKRAGLKANFINKSGSYFMQPEFKGMRGFHAAADLFEISTYQAEWLFAGDKYTGVTFGARGERKVAQRIRDFVAGEAHASYSP